MKFEILCELENLVYKAINKVDKELYLVDFGEYPKEIKKSLYDVAYILGKYRDNLAREEK